MNVKDYRHFMCQKENEFNCSFCPENNGMSSRYPCGQQNCWITVHLDRARALDEEED